MTVDDNSQVKFILSSALDGAPHMLSSTMSAMRKLLNVNSTTTVRLGVKHLVAGANWTQWACVTDDKTCSTIWQSHVNLAINLMTNTSEEYVEEELAAAQDVVALATAWIEAWVDHNPKPASCPIVLSVLQALHEPLLFMDSEKYLAVQDSIAKVCETWFVSGREGRDTIAAQASSFLLIRAIGPDARQADVKRIYNIRESLRLFDYQDETSTAMKDMLLYAFMSPIFLDCSEGIRFAAFLMSLDISWIDQIHATIKNQVPGSSKEVLDVYAQIYFRAWKSAEGMFLAKIEYSCIQDLMDRAVHAAHSADKKQAAFPKLRKLLSQFHENKKLPGVDEMLCRLYGPILWRSLNVANSTVRKNAISLLIDAFPIEDPSADEDTLNALRQKQLDNLATLLKDEDYEVRSIAIQGWCRILAIYWEVLPMEVVSDILNIIVPELAFDMSSAEVRLSVIQGIRFLFQSNPLSHLILKKYLIILGKLVHDTNQSNRSAVLDLLSEVKQTPGIKFWDIVDADHLLFRLEHDHNDVAKNIASVLMNSYFPIKKDIVRAGVLMERNARAGRKFFFLLPKITTLNLVVEFIVTLYESLHTSIEPSADNDDAEFKEMILAQFELFLDIIAVLFHSVVPELAKRKNEKLCKTLVKSFETHPLSKLLGHCEGMVGCAALFQIGKYALASNFTEIGDECQSRLQEGRTVTEDQKSILDCLFGWGLGAEVISSFVSWLDDSILAKDETVLARASVKKRKGAKKFQTVKDSHFLALNYISVILENDEMRDVLLEDQTTVTRLMEMFARAFSSLETLLADGDDNTDLTTIENDFPMDAEHDLALTAIETCFQLMIHAAHLSESQDDLHTVMSTTVSLLSHGCFTGYNVDQQIKKSAKRQNQNRTLLCEIVTRLCNVLGDCFTLGFGTLENLPACIVSCKFIMFSETVAKLWCKTIYAMAALHAEATRNIGDVDSLILLVAKSINRIFKRAFRKDSVMRTKIYKVLTASLLESASLLSNKDCNELFEEITRNCLTCKYRQDVEHEEIILDFLLKFRSHQYLFDHVMEEAWSLAQSTEDTEVQHLCCNLISQGLELSGSVFQEFKKDVMAWISQTAEDSNLRDLFAKISV